MRNIWQPLLSGPSGTVRRQFITQISAGSLIIMQLVNPVGIHQATATVSSKGQITIPAQVRASLGLRPGDRIDFVEIENR